MRFSSSTCALYANISTGEHNISNALACIAICNCYGVSKMYIKDALSEFTGANRLMEYKGTFNNASIFDDYAHHPT